MSPNQENKRKINDQKLTIDDVKALFKKLEPHDALEFVKQMKKITYQDSFPNWLHPRDNDRV